MISAFFYLQATTIKNRLVQRFKRLKQPKYLFGAVVGAAYFYFFFFRKVIGSAFGGSHAHATTTLPPELAPYLVSFGAVLLFVVIFLSWVLPSGRAALQFTEPEVAFLFPAPITRRRLIHFKLLRSQFAILISTFFLSLVFNRASYLGGSALTHAFGWWMVLSTLSLHFTAASFAREQLLSLGVHPNRRRLLAVGGLIVVGLGCYWWIRHHLAPPTDTDLSSATAMVRYFGGILQHPPIGWILAPFAMVIRPYFATDLTGFFYALAPAFAVLVAHYWWVMRADVSFEEASIEQARKLGERVAAIHSGDWRAGRNQPTKPRTAAFNLAPRGMVAVAFLWKNLIALGPFFRLRTWLILIAMILGLHVWAGFSGLNPKAYTAISIIPLAFGAWLLVLGPMIMRRDVRLMVTHFDLLKGYPLRGWQVVLGSLISSIVILAAVEWLLLLMGAPGFGASGKGRALAAGVLGVGSLGIALILPPLSGLMLSIPFAATLYFPAWMENSATRGNGGVEVMGQRLIFFAGYLIVLLVALLPAALCGAIAAFIVHWLAGTLAAIIATAVVASVIISAEFAAVVWWLGERFERFDLSRDIPR